MSTDGTALRVRITEAQPLQYRPIDLVYRLRSLVNTECQDDEWMKNLLRQSADEIERHLATINPEGGK